jgi:hypothetical protein
MLTNTIKLEFLEKGKLITTSPRQPILIIERFDHGFKAYQS